jgi:hypothetical protein
MKLNIVAKAGKLLLLGAVLLASGCSDFLEEQDPSNLAPDNFYTIPEHAEAAIAAAYADTRFIGDGAGIFSSNWQLLEAPTGTSTTETAQNSDLNNLYGLVYDGNNGHVINWWNGLYKVIAQTNLVLDRVPAITPMNEQQKNKILGEASFLRAWAFWHGQHGAHVVVLQLLRVRRPADRGPGRVLLHQLFYQRQRRAFPIRGSLHLQTLQRSGQRDGRSAGFAQRQPERAADPVRGGAADLRGSTKRDRRPQ